MTKAFVCLALFCLLAVSIGQDCKNPLLTTLGIKGEAAAAAGTALKFCKTLQKGQSCCSADTVSGIQTKVQQLGEKLTAIVSTRDKAIVMARDKTLPNFSASLSKLKDVLAKSSQMAPGLDFASMSTSFDAAGQVLLGLSGELKKTFTTFQASRTACVVEALKLQSAAWCLACDPGYATKGVGADSSITISDKVCKRLTSACYPFIAGAVAQSALLAIDAQAKLVDMMTSALTKIANNDMQGGMADMTTMMTAMLGGAVSSDPAVQLVGQVSTPDGCTANKCDFICKNLLVKGQIDSNALVLGGTPGTGAGGVTLKRLLEEEEVEEGTVVKAKLNRNRVLATGEWDPDQDEAGVTVTFQDDPADVKNGYKDDSKPAGASIVRNGLVCLVGLLAIVLF